MGWARTRGFDPHTNVTGVSGDKAKPTIQGGWVNVYRYAPSPMLHLSPVVFMTRQECDTYSQENRFACIQIPDFVEGEGL
jgi:hypothetical protein